MSTEAATEKVITEPLFVYDATKQLKDGSYVGCFDLITKPTYTDGTRVIADTKPYGGNFGTYDEAKAYAKLFAASPDLLEAAQYAVECFDRLWAETGNLGDNGDQAYNALKSAINKATTL